MLDLLKCLLILAIGTVFFGKIVSRTVKKELSSADGMEIGAALALIFFTLLTVALGSASILYGWTIWAVITVMAAFCIKDFVPFMSRTFNGALRTFKESSPAQRALLSLAMVMCLAAMALCLQPPMENDALMYKFIGPKLFTAHHGIFHTPDVPALYLRWGGVFLTTFGYTLAGEVGAFFFTNVTGLLLLLAAFNFFRDKRLKYLSLLAMISIPLLWWILSWHADDLPAALFCLLAVKHLSEHLSTRSKSSLAFLGIFLGFAICLKYIPGFLAIPVFMILALDAIKTDPKRLVRTLSIVAAGIILLNLPLTVLNIAELGSPAFPFIKGSVEDVSILTRAEADECFSIISQPSDLSLLGSIFKLSTYHFRFGFFVLSVFPLALFYWKRVPQGVRYMFICSAGAFLITLSILVYWFPPSQMNVFYMIAPSTYLLCFYVCMIPACVHILRVALDDFHAVARICTVTVLVLLTVFIVIGIVFKVNLGKLEPMFDSESRIDYLRTNTKTYRIAEFYNGSRADLDKILICDAECYFFDEPYIHSTNIVKNIDWGTLDKDGFLSYIQANGVTHVLSSSKMHFETYASWRFFSKHPELLSEELTEVYRDGRTALYEIKGN